jgi:transposase
MKRGIDISKDTFDVASQSGTDQPFQMAQYKNTQRGINVFKRSISKDDHCVMEATGPYWYRLAMSLVEDGYKVSVVNPLQIKRFTQMQLKRAKTDAADARMICAYAYMVNPPLFSAPPAYSTHLQELKSVRQQLVKTRTMFSNQLHALNQMHIVDKIALTSCRKMVETINRQLENIQDQMTVLIRKHCQAIFDLLQSIPGIGPCAAVELITATKGFTAFSQAKSFAAYIGICSRPYQSGTSIKGAGHICKLGMSTTRTMMYLCALSAVRHNKACKVFYDRLLKAGKQKLVALIAVANKLIRQVFAVVNNNSPFYDEPKFQICF